MSAQKFLKIDTALLEATAPLLNLTAGSSMTLASNLLGLLRTAKVIANLPSDAFIKLDASTLTVTSGAAIKVAGGSFLKVTGDLIQLSNASILDGPQCRGRLRRQCVGGRRSFRRDRRQFNYVTNNLCPSLDFGTNVHVAVAGGATVDITNPVKNPGSAR